MFDKYDSDKSGSIDADELLNLVKDWKIEALIPESDIRGSILYTVKWSMFYVLFYRMDEKGRL